MAIKNDWEPHLTEREKSQMARWGRLLESAKREVVRIQSNRDFLRRRAVQRARAANKKEERA